MELKEKDHRFRKDKIETSRKKKFLNRIFLYLEQLTYHEIVYNNK